MNDNPYASPVEKCGEPDWHHRWLIGCTYGSLLSMIIWLCAFAQMAPHEARYSIALPIGCALLSEVLLVMFLVALGDYEEQAQ